MAKKTFRETLEANDAAQRAWGAMFGKPVPDHLLTNVGPKRKYVKGTEPSEADILKACLKLLKAHPKVAIAYRVNSGTFEMGSGDNKRYIRANTQRGISDIMGALKDGRVLACEVKSAKGIAHEHQQAFLDKINAAGGLGFIARSVDDVINALKGA